MPFIINKTGSDFIDIKEGSLVIHSDKNITFVREGVPKNMPIPEYHIVTERSASQQSAGTHETLSPTSLAIKLSEYEK